MKKINIITAIFAIAVFLLPSCSKDFLELSPKVNKLEASAYTTEDDAFLSLACVYNGLVVQPWMFVPMMADIRSDDTFTGGDASGSDMIQYQEQERYNMSAENAAGSALYNRCYSGIYRANLFLEKAPEIQWKSEATKKRMVAEAKFLRAYFYWDLVRHFGWIQEVPSVISDPEGHRALPQLTPEEIYKIVVRDLYAAYLDLPTTISTTETGRASKYAAGALLARIYLYYTGVKASFPELGLSGTLSDGTKVIDKTFVLTVLKDIIDNGGFQVLPNYADVFAYGNQNNKEDIFCFQYSANGGNGDWGGWGVTGNFSSVMYGPRSPEGDGNLTPGWSFGVLTFDLVNEYESGDARKNATVYDAGTSLTKYTRGYCNTNYFNKKFLPLKEAQGSKGDPQLNYGWNYPDIRYTDVLLMYAELDMAAGLPYFNQVRTRALGAGAAKESITLADIQHERRVEFGGEGHRYWDLLRWGATYAATRIAAGWGSVPTNNNMVNVPDFAVRPFKANTLGMFPIPASEIRNSTVKQFVPAYK
jgi:starch-binding outer membrane protein, SusD/RagB family